MSLQSGNYRRVAPFTWISTSLVVAVLSILLLQAPIGPPGASDGKASPPGVNDPGLVTVPGSGIGKVVANITVGIAPRAIVYNSGNGDVYVTNARDSNISVVAGTSLSSTVSIRGGLTPELGAYDVGNGKLYVAEAGGNVSLVSGTSLAGSVPVGLSPQGLVYDPGNGDVYVANEYSGNVSVLSGTTSVGTVVVGNGPTSLTYDSGNGDIYVAASNCNGGCGVTGNVSVISGTSLVARLPVGASVDPAALTYDSTNGYVYVANQASNNVSVVSGTSFVRSIAVGTGPSSILFDPGNGDVYVGNYGSNNVSVISGTSVIGSIPVNGWGGGPSGFAYGPANGYVYVAEGMWVGNVSVLSGTSLLGTISLSGCSLGAGLCLEGMATIITYDPTGSGDVYVTGPNCGIGCNPSRVAVIATGSSAGAPTISSFTISPSPISVGWTTYLNVSASGGSGTLSYAYAGLPPGCLTSNVPSLACHPTASGTFTTRVYVNDTASHSATATASLTVNSAAPGPTISSFGASPSPIQVGWTTYLNVSASGGSAPLVYAFAGLPAGCTSGNVASLACSPTVSGTFTIRVYVNDSASRSAMSTTSLKVNPAGTSPVISSFTATPPTLTLGASTALAVSASGGTGALSYSYAGLPPGCASSNSASLSCTPTATGSFTVRVYVNDTASNSATRTTSLTVNPTATNALASVTVSPVASNLSTGGSQSFTAAANCAGGSCPSGLTYAWTQSSSLGSLSAQAGATTTFTAGSSPGTETLTVTASLNGVSKSASATITTSTPQTAPPTFLGLPQTEGYLLLGAIVSGVILALVAIVLLARRKRKQAEPAAHAPRGPPPPQYPYGYDPGYVPQGPSQYPPYPPQ